MKVRTAEAGVGGRAFELLLRFVIITAFALLSGCRYEKTQLRVHNDTSMAIQHLDVLSPEETVEFGDVGARELSEYRTLRDGVGPYASFRFVLNGVPVKQYVADFVGWKPLNGTAFTYRIKLKSGTSQPFFGGRCSDRRQIKARKHDHDSLELSFRDALVAWSSLLNQLARVGKPMGVFRVRRWL